MCRDKGSDASIAYIGMNYFDRYLSYKVIEKDKIELLSWMCIYLASSVHDCRTKHLSFVAPFRVGYCLERDMCSN